MNLTSQKNIAARVLKCGRSRVWFDPSRIADISEAITSADIRRLINDGVIKKMPKKGLSSFRRKKVAEQKKKGRRRNKGSIKGGAKTRLDRKKAWIQKIRALRKMAKELKSNSKIDNRIYRDIYRKSKSGLFRSRSHLMTYLERNNLVKKDEKKEIPKENK